MKRILCVVIAAMLLSGSAEAQWLKYRDPHLPRNADGNPDLDAAAPRSSDGHPDLSGIWRTTEQTVRFPNGDEDFKYLYDLAADTGDVPMQPWAQRVYRERLDNHGRDRPSSNCISHGLTDFDAHITPRKIVQTPGVIVVLFEYYNHYRQIFTDGRALPADPNPSWLGNSVGHWEGDTLVVQSNGFNDRSWLDDSGHPHSESLKVTERFTRENLGHMRVQLTIDDPVAYTKPWTVMLPWELMPDTDLIEGMCENERDRAHIDASAKQPQRKARKK